VKGKKQQKDSKSSEGHSDSYAAPSRAVAPVRPAVKKAPARSTAIPASQVRTAVGKFLANPRPDLKPGITARKREQLAYTHGEELHEALKKGDIVAMIDALKAGADPNKPDPKHEWNKETPLGLAARLGRADAVRCLLACPGIKVNVSYQLDSMKDVSPVTPLYVALCAWKKDLHKRDKALAKLQEGIVRSLLKKGAKLEVRDQELLTELEEGKVKEEEE